MCCNCILIEYMISRTLSHCPVCVTLQSTSSAQLVSVRQRERELERELLKSQKENMELRFDYEQAVLELPRLRVREMGEGERLDKVNDMKWCHYCHRLE